jgi:hypothetical protein
MARLASAAARIRAIFALDLRSLALLRIGLGLLLLADLAARAADFRAHYTDFGILPRAELGGYTWRTVWTLHGLASPSAPAVAGLFALAAVFAVLLALGWRTRLATFASWLLVSSVQYRQPALAHGGDVLLRMLLFWGLFLPLGARWSLDARSGRARPAEAGVAHVSVATAALILQIALVYAFSVLNRTGPTWWEGRALHDALHFDQFASRQGIWLRENGAALLAPLTHVAIWFEALAPLLLFSPIATGALRALAVALFLGFHASLALLFHIGLFPAVCAAGWLALLPTWLWSRLAGAPGADAPQWQPRAWRDGLAGLALAFVLASNASTVRGGALGAGLPQGWDLPAQLFYLDQVWGLFSPDPAIYDGWYVILGIQRDGEEVSPFWRDRPVSFEKPPVVTETMNIRWREFFFRLQQDARDPRWRSFGRWLCRAWNERHTGAAQLDRAYVYYVEETTGASGPRRERTLTLMAHDCG